MIIECLRFAFFFSFLKKKNHYPSAGGLLRRPRSMCVRSCIGGQRCDYSDAGKRPERRQVVQGIRRCLRVFSNARPGHGSYLVVSV